MLNDKDMLNDVLGSVKGSLGTYAKVISECSDQSLRQTLQQIRNGCEQYQFNLYQVAEQKNFYKPANPASPQDIQEVKSTIQGS